jgi:hypothetical protein
MQQHRLVAVIGTIALDKLTEYCRPPAALPSGIYRNNSLFEETWHDSHNFQAPQASKKVLFNMQQCHQLADFGTIDLEEMWTGSKTIF